MSLLPTKPAVSVIASTPSTMVKRYGSVSTDARRFKSRSTMPIPVSAAAVKARITNCPQTAAASSISPGRTEKPFAAIIQSIMPA